MNAARPDIRPAALARLLVRVAAPGAIRQDVLADLQEEFDSIAAALGPRSARRWYWRQAWRSAGPLVARRVHRHQPRSSGGGSMIRDLGSDLRYGWRMAKRAPVLAGIVIFAIALGISATTAIVSVMEGVFIKSLPFAEPARLVRFSTILRQFGQAPEVNFLDARDWKAAAHTLDGIALYDAEPDTLRLDPGTPAFSATVLSVGEGLTEVLRLAPAEGRMFAPEEFTFGGPRAVMLGYRFWRQRFGGDPHIVGRSLILGPQPFTIVGVLPDSATRFPVGGAEVWTPLTFPPDSFLNSRGSIALSAVGRLRSGVDRSAAQTELTAIAQRLAAAYPETNRSRGIVIEPLQAAMVGPIRPMILLLAASIAALLAIACASIANLLLAHAHTRTREFAVRTAIGASRARLVRQSWTESLGLFGVAGALGIAIAPAITAALLSRYPEALPLASDVRIDVRVLVISAAVTLGAALLAGIPRASRVRALAISSALRAGERGSLSRSHRRTAGAFVVAQVSLSMLLLFGGVVLLKAFLTLSSTTPGFDAAHVVTMHASLPPAEHATPATMARTQDAVRDAARNIPGVSDAAHAMFIPFAAGSWPDGFRRVGTSDGPPSHPMAHFFMVSPEYLHVMGIPILRGRGLTRGDDERAPRAIVVSQSFAARSFPGLDAVGRSILWNDDKWEIVGISADVRHESLWDPLDSDVYVPRHQVVRENTWLLVRTDRPAEAIAAELDARLRAINPAIAITDIKSMEQRLADSAAPERFRALVTGSLAALSLMLAVVGIYGVVSYGVERRTHEIGVRMALGESPVSVLRSVVASTWRTTAVGVAPGILACVYAGRWLQASMVGIDPHQAGAIGMVTAIFFAAATVAAFGPARRASLIDPIAALRSE